MRDREAMQQLDDSQEDAGRGEMDGAVDEMDAAVDHSDGTESNPDAAAEEAGADVGCDLDCDASGADAPAGPIGPLADASTCVPAPPDLPGIFVSLSGTAAANCGSATAPCKSISQGVERAVSTERSFVYIDSGSYAEAITLPAGTAERRLSVRAS